MSEQATFPFAPRQEVPEDICERKHGGNPQSVAANRRNSALRAEQRYLVWALIRDYPRTMKEIAEFLGVGFNTVSGRGSELKKWGFVVPTGEIRDGAAVLRITEKANENRGA